MILKGIVPGLFLLARASAADEILPGTVPLTVDRPLDQVMDEGLNMFCLRELAASPRLRSERWQDDLVTGVALEKSLTDHRNYFRSLIGAVDVRVPPSRMRRPVTDCCRRLRLGGKRRITLDGRVKHWRSQLSPALKLPNGGRVHMNSATTDHC